MLKAVSLSRGRVAADLGVDKSVVSRWASGVNAPSEENLVRLTRMIAARRPGFTMLDWDYDLGHFDAQFGGIRLPDRDTPPLGGALAGGALAEWLGGRAMGDAMRASAGVTAACAGFWRITQPSIGLPPVFFHQQMIVTPAPDGLLRFRVGYFDVRFEGWAFAVRNQLYFVGSDVLRGNQLYGIYNLPSGERADLLEGIAMTCLPDVGGMPGSQLCVFERIGVLSGNADADDRHYEELSQRSPIATEHSAPDDLRRFLLRDTITPAMNPAALTLPFVDSMSIGARWGDAIAPRRVVPRRASVAAADLPAPSSAASADPMARLSFGLVEAAEKETARRGRAYFGRWRVTRLSARGTMAFVVEHLLIRPDGDGMWLEHYAGGHKLAGWLLVLNNRLYAMACDDSDDSFATYLLNGVVGPRADCIDGLLMSVGSDRHADPFAMAIVLDRVGALEGGEADAAWAEAAAHGPVAAETVSPDIRAALCRDFGPTAAAAGGEAILRIPFNRSLSKGQLHAAG